MAMIAQTALEVREDADVVIDVADSGDSAGKPRARARASNTRALLLGAFLLVHTATPFARRPLPVICSHMCVPPDEVEGSSRTKVITKGAAQRIIDCRTPSGTKLIMNGEDTEAQQKRRQ